MPTPEALARQIIDQKLTAAGWIVQDFKALNLGAGPGVAVREFQTASGPADYVLFVSRKAVGVVEAKPEGTTLRGVFEQSARYMANFPEQIPHVELPLRSACAEVLQVGNKKIIWKNSNSNKGKSNLR